MMGEKQMSLNLETEQALGIGRIWQLGPRILILVGDLDMGDWLQEEFQRKGCAVAVATCGQEGLGLVRSGLVDLVISEMTLSDLPGMDLLRAMRAFKKAPKVILTMLHHSEYLAARAIENGASAVLCKPFRIEQLFALAAHALEQ